MNIFHLDKNLKLCAVYHCDQHVRKMIIEYAQMLSTAHRVLDPDNNLEIYKKAYTNHPCTIWVRQNASNYLYMYELFILLCEEFKYRFEKIHKTSLLISNLTNIPNHIDHSLELSNIPLCMPDQYKSDDYVHSYRKFYISKKDSFKRAKPIWTKRSIPNWYN